MKAFLIKHRGFSSLFILVLILFAPQSAIACSVCTASQQVCTSSHQVCTQEQQTCVLSHQECTSSHQQCNSYSQVCDSYTQVCDSYDSYGDCVSYSSQCSGYSEVCDSYSTVCDAYQTVCDSYTTTCVSYDTVCDSYATECTQYTNEETLVLQGNVYSAFNSAPAYGATVTVTDNNSGAVQTTTANGTGSYGVTITALDASSTNPALSLTVCASQPNVFNQNCYQVNSVDSCNALILNQNLSLTPIAPPAPTGFTLSNISTTQVQSTWTSGGGSTVGFLLLYVPGVVSNLDCSGGTNVGNGNSTLTSSLTPGTTYTFALCSYDSSGQESASSVAQIRTPFPAPPVITNLALSSPNYAQIDYTFNSGGGSTAGFIENIASGNVPNLGCSGGTDIGLNTNGSLTGLSPSTQYTIAICSYNPDHVLSANVLNTVTTQAFPLPPVPNNLAANSSAYNSANVSWGNSGGTTTGFIVNWAAGNNPALKCVGGVDVGTALSQTISGLTSNTQYTIAVCAYNNQFANSQSAVTLVTTQMAAVANPASGLVLSSGSSSTISASWTNGGGGTTGFIVKAMSGNNPSLTCAGGTDVGNVTSNTLTGLNPNSLYTIAVCAYNLIAVQTTSVVSTVTTQQIAPPLTPTGFQLSGINSTSLIANWANAGGTTSGFFLNSAPGNVPSLTCNGGVDKGLNVSGIVQNLNPGTAYTFALCAYNAVGAKSSSLTAMATTPPVSAAALPFTAAFFSDSGSSLSGSWNIFNGGFSLSSGKLVPFSTYTSEAVLNNLNKSDVAVQAYVDVTNGTYTQSGLITRYSGPGDSNMYLGTLYKAATNSYYLLMYKNVGGTWTQIGYQAVSAGSGLLRFDAHGTTLALSLNGGTPLTVTDSALTSGAVGIRAYLGTYTSFRADAWTQLVAPPPYPAAALPFTDTFFSDAGSAIGSDWQVFGGGFNLSSGKLLPQGTSLSEAVLNNVNKADVAIQAYVDVTNGTYTQSGLIARYSGPGDSNMYWGALYKAGTNSYYLLIYKNVSGTWTQIGYQSVAAGSGLLRFDAHGTTLALSINGGTPLKITDSALTSGGVGVRAYLGTYTSFRADDWSASVPGAPAVPAAASFLYLDNFINDPVGALSSNWSVPVGGFIVGSGRVTQTQPVSIATVSGKTAADVTLQAYIDANAAQYTQSGLLARYSGPGDSNFYCGFVYQYLPGQYVAYIFKNVSGTWTVLSAAIVPTGTGLLKFDVHGTSLQLTYNGIVVGTATDSSITSAGSFGMRDSSVGGSCSKFEAQPYTATPYAF